MRREEGRGGDALFEFGSVTIKQIFILADGNDGAQIGRYGMELRPVEGIRAIGPAGVRRNSSDVAPAFAVDESGRMGDDADSIRRKPQDRGLEEEGEESTEERVETAESVTAPGDRAKKVNFFA